MVETVSRPLSSYKVAAEQRKLIEDIENRSAELLEVLERFQKEYGGDNLESAVFARAFNFTHDLVRNEALDFILNEARSAIIASEEFNHPLFINHFLQAIVIGFSNSEMVSITIDEENKAVTGVTVDMSFLGDIEEYADAVIEAREKLNIGSINPEAGSEDTMTGAEARSAIWREKIYGVAREGVRVLKYFARTKKTVDITSRYKGKYEKTIEARLNILGNKAPYWYIIENGNSAGFASDIGGTPYPNVEPTGFVDGIKLALSDAVANAYKIYKAEAEEFLSGLIAKDYGVEEWSPSIKELPRAMKDMIHDKLDPATVSQALQGVGDEAANIIRTDKGQAKLKITRTGKGQVVARNKLGHYAKAIDILGE